MAMSVVYTNFLGRVVHENREGVERYYAPDTLGSTQALVDMEGNVTDAYDYWSYGEEREHVGDSPTDLTFLGVLGYVRDILNKLYYVRARHLRPELGRWQTVDPLWPIESQYSYAESNPVGATDSSGLSSGCENRVWEFVGYDDRTERSCGQRKGTYDGHLNLGWGNIVDTSLNVGEDGTARAASLSARSPGPRRDAGVPTACCCLTAAERSCPSA